MSLSKRSNETNKDQKHYKFNAIDKRGREIGANIFTSEVDFEAQDPAATWGYTIEPGHYFCLRVHTTRSGLSYGPIQSTRYFKMVEERDQAISKYLKEAQKRADKLAGAR